MTFGFGYRQRLARRVSSSTPSPASVVAKSLESVWALGAAGTGPRSTPTKTIGVDALPANASLAGSVVTLGAGGGTFEGWNVTAHQIAVTGNGWMIQDNKHAITGGTVSYPYDVTGNDNTIRYCEFDGLYGAAIAYGPYIKGLRNVVEYCKSWGAAGDPFTSGAQDATDANRNVFRYNWIRVGGWDNPASHCDLISINRGSAHVHHNLIDATSYLSRSYATSSLAASAPINVHASGKFTYGLTNAVRMSASAGAIGTPLIENNVIIGHKRGGFYPFQTVAGANGVGGANVQNNVIEEGVTGALFHPTSNGTITLTGNVRYSDAVAWTGTTGTTAAVPGTMAIDSLTATGINTATAVFDRPSHYTSIEVRYSTDQSNWSTATLADANQGTITGLPYSPTPALLYIQMRGVNGNGNGPWSASKTVTLTAAPTNAFTQANNQGSAYSTAAAPWSGITAARRMAFFIDMEDNSGSGVCIMGQGGANYELQRGSSSLYKLTLVGSTTLQATTGSAIATGKRVKHLITVDLTVNGTDAGGTVNSVVKWWTYDVQADTLTVQTLTGANANTLAGTRTINLASVWANLLVGARTSGAIPATAKYEVVGILAGDNTLALPNPADKAAFLAAFDDTNCQATLAGWTGAWWSLAATGVGASDGSNANTWNATGGLNNRVSGKPALIKTAGTYA